MSISKQKKYVHLIKNKISRTHYRVRVLMFYLFFKQNYKSSLSTCIHQSYSDNFSDFTSRAFECKILTAVKFVSKSLFNPLQVLYILMYKFCTKLIEAYKVFYVYNWWYIQESQDFGLLPIYLVKDFLYT